MFWKAASDGRTSAGELAPAFGSHLLSTPELDFGGHRSSLCPQPWKLSPWPLPMLKWADVGRGQGEFGKQSLGCLGRAFRA